MGKVKIEKSRAGEDREKGYIYRERKDGGKKRRRGKGDVRGRK